jgi:UDP-glucose 4-epimerase
MQNSNRTILVTGGAGYIGSHFCKALRGAGFLPITYDNLSSGHLWAVKWGPFEEGDIIDSSCLAAVIEKYRPIAVMHFAAFISVRDSVINPNLFYQNNIEVCR